MVRRRPDGRSRAGPRFVAGVSTRAGLDGRRRGHRGIDDCGGPHVRELVIDHDDPDNPVSAGCLVLAMVWRKTVGGAGKVGGTIVFRADLAYAQRPRHERA